MLPYRLGAVGEVHIMFAQWGNVAGIACVCTFPFRTFGTPAVFIRNPAYPYPPRSPCFGFLARGCTWVVLECCPCLGTALDTPAECKLDAHLARMGSGGATATFSKTMALRRLHWRNSPLGEALYALNLYKVGNVCLCVSLSVGVGGCGFGGGGWVCV